MSPSGRLPSGPADPRRRWWALVALTVALLATVPVSAQEPDSRLPITGAATWAPDGSGLVYVSDATGNQQIWLMGADGTQQRRISDGHANDSYPSYSPDGSRILFVSDRDGNSEIYTMAGDGSDLVRLTETAEPEAMPTWSPDGSRIWFAIPADPATAHSMRADGSDRQRFSADGWVEIYPVESPDGDRVAFTGRKSDEATFYIMVSDREHTNPLNVSGLAVPSYNQSWSPDGTRLAFVANIGGVGHSAIFVVNADGSGRTQLTDPEIGSYQPRWSPDGTRISFKKGWNDDHVGVFSMRPDGSDPQQLTNR